MDETYTEKTHFRIIIEGHCSAGKLERAGESRKSTWNYVVDSIIDYCPDAGIEIDKLKIIKE